VLECVSGTYRAIFGDLKSRNMTLKLLLCNELHMWDVMESCGRVQRMDGVYTASVVVRVREFLRYVYV